MLSETNQLKKDISDDFTYEGEPKNPEIIFWRADSS